MSTHLQTSLQSALRAIPGSDFRSGHLALLKTLGYASDKSMPIPGADPAKFVEFAETNSGKQLHPEKAKLSEWTTSAEETPTELENEYERLTWLVIRGEGKRH